MSMDLYVFIEGHPSLNAVEWQQALDARALPVQLTKGVDLAGHSGFLPVVLDGRPTGFYFLREDATELASDIPEIEAAHLNKATVYNLNFGRPFLECARAYYSASALVATVNGPAFYPQDGKFLTFEELRAAGSEFIKLSV